MYFKVIAFFLFLNASLFAQNVGLASWYGKKFQGRTTASGEPFNMYAYTAAHRTLPFGTIVTVTNLKNGKTVNVKVNDRGPFKAKRIIDLSYQAAKHIGLVSAGTGKVRIHIKGSKPQKTPITASKPLVNVEKNKDLASMMEYALMVTDPRRINKKKMIPLTQRPQNSELKSTKVQIGSFTTKLAAQQFINKERNKGYKMDIVPVYFKNLQQTRYKVVVLSNSKENALAIVKSKQYNGAYLLK